MSINNKEITAMKRMNMLARVGFILSLGSLVANIILPIIGDKLSWISLISSTVALILCVFIFIISKGEIKAATAEAAKAEVALAKQIIKEKEAKKAPVKKAPAKKTAAKKAPAKKAPVKKTAAKKAPAKK
jgi:uncharacterized membrane protein